jgi:hypothetical protein
MCLADLTSRGVLPSEVCKIKFDNESSIMRRPWPMVKNVTDGQFVGFIWNNCIWLT